MSQVNQNITSGDIPLVRLDDVVPADAKIYVLKSDTQGHEFGVLSGARQLLARAKVHVMMLEFWPQGALENGFDSKNLLDLLHEYGFFCFDGGYTVYNYWGRPRVPYAFNDFLKGVKTPLGGWDDLVCSRFDS
ncbi:hypothetical protein HXX76_009447 [Chlamydomonas incerta]|uniref:Methyltransferase FkbM domain-containing protein n=1 Tax=Chlamydomonas incerta TaxID=51695 RepID=A0A835STY2_CHLIN|nr:hypothetical protein HXX76_009447 [Chlamydomonas incerta]|eukprot:KAG2431432.1 hypothetical protein HXX76_009447 [Chlamydomonas incerta]